MLFCARAFIAKHSKRLTSATFILAAAPDRRALTWLAAIALVLATTPADASPFAYVVGNNNAIESVDAATQADSSAGATIFPTDSLAISPSGALYSADPNGVLFNVTGPNFPVGPTGYAQIADLDYATNGLWGFSNQSQTLFFYDLTLNGVTSSLTDPALSAYTITGVAHRASDGSVFLSGYDGSSVDWLFQVAPSATSAALVGSLVHGDGVSYVSDIDFDASSGALYAMTWFHRWFYTVDPTTAATALVSVGPHRDATGMALPAVPEPGTLALTLLGIAGIAGRRAMGSTR